MEDIKGIFKPLGLYNQKSERIVSLTKYILRDCNGIIPNDKDRLLNGPGIGEYIANAILTFAFDQNEVPLDNNLKRIALNVWNLKKKEEVIDFYKKFEYNGIQHYEFPNYWFKDTSEGYKAWISYIERDQIKKEICKSNNIILIEFPHYLDRALEHPNKIRSHIIKKFELATIQTLK